MATIEGTQLISPERLKQIKYALIGMSRAFAKRVQPAYRAMGWKWASTDGPPGEHDITSELRNRIHLLSPGETEQSIASGGLRAGYLYIDGQWEGYISFEVSEYIFEGELDGS